MHICAEQRQTVIQAMYADRNDPEVVVAAFDEGEDDSFTSDELSASHYMRNADTVY